jgi:hypothetical protein
VQVPYETERELDDLVYALLDRYPSGRRRSPLLHRVVRMPGRQRPVLVVAGWAVNITRCVAGALRYTRRSHVEDLTRCPRTQRKTDQLAAHMEGVR